MTFIVRNYKELLWIGLNIVTALMNLWFASWSNFAWVHGLFWAAHIICAGYWVWAIFDNIEQDEIKQEAASVEEVN